jgi:hypothetical protein
MKLLLAILLIGVAVHAGEIGLPTERFALPEVEGAHLICAYDWIASDWVGEHVEYDGEGSYDFEIQAWNRWYWVGLWDVAAGEYVWSKWVGHFLTGGE